MIAGLILAIETTVHYTVNPGDDSHIKAFGVNFDAGEPAYLGDGRDFDDRRLSGGAQDLDMVGHAWDEATSMTREEGVAA